MSERNTSFTEIPPIEYSLNFDWGTFSVSKLANELYGLTPFRSEDVQEDTGIEVPNLNDYRVNALLAVPGELDIPDVPIMGQYISTEWDSKGELTVIASFGGDRSTMTDSLITDMMTSFAEAHDMDIDYLRGHTVDIEGNSIDETLSNQVPQLLAHILADRIGTAIKSEIFEREQNRIEQDALKRFKRIGFISLASFGLIVASTPVIARGVFEIAPVDTFLASFGGMQTYSMIKEFKKYVNTNSNHERLAGIVSFLMGEKVETGIHQSFCRRHFDEQVEDKLS